MTASVAVRACGAVSNMPAVVFVAVTFGVQFAINGDGEDLGSAGR